jgi:Peptidase A4 family
LWSVIDIARKGCEMTLASRAKKCPLRLIVLILVFLATSAIGISKGNASVAISNHRDFHNEALLPHVTSVTSPIWAGYVLHSAAEYPLQTVDSQISIPQILCRASGKTLMYAWVGLGGVGESSLPQAGFAGGCIAGIASYFAWTEWYDPVKKNHSVVVRGFKIVPGDQLEVNIVDNTPTSYSVTMSEWNPATPSHVRTVMVPLSNPQGVPVDNAAECIVERPALAGGGYQPLSSFGEVTFTSCEVYEQVPLETDFVDIVTGVQYLAEQPTADSAIVGQPTGIVLPVTRLNIVVGTKTLARTSSGVTNTVAGTSTFAVSSVATSSHVGEWTASSLTISPQGLGAVKIGMTLNNASEAAGIPIVVSGDSFYAPVRSTRYPHLYVGMGANNKIACVGAGEPSNIQSVTTPEGFRLGETLERLKSIYGNRLHYVPAPTNGGMTDFAGYLVRESSGNLAFIVSSTGIVSGVKGGPGVVPNSCTG